jgi:hypothetical protein
LANRQPASSERHSRGGVDPAAKAVEPIRPNATMATGRVAPCVRQKRKPRMDENISVSMFINFVIVADVSIVLYPSPQIFLKPDDVKKLV